MTCSQQLLIWQDCSMWWDQQNLDKPRRDSDGVRWNVRVWHDVVKNKHVARVFFWNDERDVCGVRIFGPDERTHVTALHAFSGIL